MTLGLLIALGAGVLLWYVIEREALAERHRQQLAEYERGYLAGWSDCLRIQRVLKPGDVVVTQPRRST